MHELYDIRNKDGSKFCERYLDEYGEIQLKTTNCTISLTELQKLAFNPYDANHNRNKRNFNHKK